MKKGARMAKKGEKRKLLCYYALLLTVVAVIGGLGTLAAHRAQTRPVQKIRRPENGQEAREEQLLVDDGEQRIPVTVRVSAREKTEDEVNMLLAAAQTELAEGLPGENASLASVTKPLFMPASAQDGQVAVSWSCDQPEYVSYDGTLGEEIPADGVVVWLEATLQCQQQVRYYRENVTVCPPEKGIGAEGMTEALLAADQIKTGEYYELPQRLQKKKLVWYRQLDNPAPAAAMALLFIGLMLPLQRKEASKQKKQQYRDSLLQAYPTLVSQIRLYLGAGMSLLQAFSCMAEHEKDRAENILERECGILVREVAQGIPEGEALQRFGERSGLWEYRTFCSMLLQNRKKGNDSLLPMLHNEAEKAFAERQRRARIMGNEAGTKLLMPMILMLAVVLILVLFPASMSFYA